jgi:hypothetical protein
MFEENFGKKLAGKIEIDYVFQALTSFTENRNVPSERTKPWEQHMLYCVAKAK